MTEPAIDAGVDTLQVDEAPEQQPGAEREHHRQRHLGDDQPVARAPCAASTGRRSRVLFQRLVRLGASALNHRQQHQPETPPPSSTARTSAATRALRAAPRPNVVSCGGTSAFEARIATRASANPASAAGGREHGDLGEQLLRQPPPTGAERDAHGKFALPAARARQHQAGQVRAGDEQHERDRAEHENPGRPHVLEARRWRTAWRQPPARVLRKLRRVIGGDARRDRRQLGFGRPPRRARRQPARSPRSCACCAAPDRRSRPTESRGRCRCSSSSGGITPTSVAALPLTRIVRADERAVGMKARRSTGDG